MSTQLSDIKKKLVTALKGYKGFMSAMTEIEEEEKKLVHETIRKIDTEKMKIIRKKIADS